MGFVNLKMGLFGQFQCFGVFPGVLHRSNIDRGLFIGSLFRACYHARITRVKLARAYKLSIISQKLLFHTSFCLYLAVARALNYRVSTHTPA